MKAEYANIFIRAAVEVFQKEVGAKLSRKELSRKNAPVPSMPISIILGITGFMRGQVVYAMGPDFAYRIARAMLPNKLPADVKKLVNSAVSEIANIITGQASIALAGETETIHLTPPVVLMASDLTVDFLALPTIAVSLISEIGLLEINIALTEPGGR
jgi:chemotaxis protein CheX